MIRLYLSHTHTLTRILLTEQKRAYAYIYIYDIDLTSVLQSIQTMCMQNSFMQYLFLYIQQMNMQMHQLIFVKSDGICIETPSNVIISVKREILST